MTVSELIHTLEMFPPLMEVYVQTISTGLNKIDSVEKDNGLGIVELKWNTKNVMPPEPSVYPMDIMDIPASPSISLGFGGNTSDTTQEGTDRWAKIQATQSFYGD